MDALTPVLRLHQHRCWVNSKLIATCGHLTDEQLKQHFPIGQGSVWRTLLHLMGAEYIWLETLLGNENPVFPGDLPDQLVGNQLAEGGMTTMEELQTRWKTLDDRWDEYLSGLNADDLPQDIYKVSTSSHFGQRRPTSLMDVLLHVCTHAHYTTAQLINMLRHLGVKELLDPMLITLARSED
ncbi:MAG: DinB family protein [Planctomycetota bacterium]